VRSLGDTALLREAADADEAGTLAEILRRSSEPGVLDVVAGLDSVVVHLDPAVTERELVAEELRRARARTVRRRGRTVVLPTSFEGPDIEEVGEMSGLGAEGVRQALMSASLRVSVLGFTPGFAYLSGLPAPLAAVPRRATPRQSVPAGSVALAGGYAAVYPQSTPGGWQLIGRTDAVLFDPEVVPYAVLRPGDRVRFKPVSADALAPAPPEPGPRLSRRDDGCVFVVESPGTFTTLQDRGRLGFAHLGVPRAGAADPVAYALANALVGNQPGSACLEVTATGPDLRCRRDTYLAVVGWDTAVAIDGRPVKTGRVLPIAPGQRLSVGSAGRALRAYVAVRGGFTGPLVFGSRSADRLVGLGGGPLVAGDELSSREGEGPMADHLRPGSVDAGAGQSRVLRVLPVEDGSWVGGLLGRAFVVEPASDRVGIRVRPVEGDAVPGGGGAVSAGTTVGTVQLPPEGNPVLLLPDHATLGGYRVGAVVISADWGELGRCRPGDTLELAPVGLEEADEARRALRRAVADAVVGSYPLRAG
jgi:KipI family sensor histidine kinase inhibitor